MGKSRVESLGSRARRNRYMAAPWRHAGMSFEFWPAAGPLLRRIAMVRIVRTHCHDRHYVAEASRLLILSGRQWGGKQRIRAAGMWAATSENEKRCRPCGARSEVLALTFLVRVFATANLRLERLTCVNLAGRASARGRRSSFLAFRRCRRRFGCGFGSPGRCGYRGCQRPG